MRQLTVLVDERPGVLAEITLALAGRDINIDSIVADSAREKGVVTLTVDAYDDALVALRDAGFAAVSENALVLRLEDRPGALAKIALRFKEANISIFSMRILRREGGYSWVTLVSEENERAAQLVTDHLVSTHPSAPPSSTES